ncbi:hypothetical protein PI125_g14853 [Phytophthora idaei]|nr:hypothetical protein PI125_g14853 [Phytophthora idaei]KAG3143895.1 hypothetical protein PI126_g14403 [Phytophthora idaei]
MHHTLRIAAIAQITSQLAFDLQDHLPPKANMPRHRIPTHYTLLFMVTTVDGWLAARVCGESRKAFAKSRGVPRPSLQNWERQIHRLREKIRRHPRAGPSLPPVLPRESRLTLSGSGHMSICTGGRHAVRFQ